MIFNGITSSVHNDVTTSWKILLKLFSTVLRNFSNSFNVFSAELTAFL